MLLDQLKAQPILKLMIIDSHKNDIELQKKIQLVKDGGKTQYSIGDDGGIYHKGRLCVSEDMGVKNKLLHEAHNTVFTMRPGGNKMYQDLKQYYGWQGMKKDMTDYVSKCLTCQQVKVEHQVPSGMLNLTPIP